MKKILYLITQSELGGAQRYILDLANGFKGEYEIAVAFGEQGDNGELAKQLHKSGFKTYDLKHLKRPISPINDLRCIFEIKQLIETITPDIIHLNSSKVSILGSVAAKLLRLQKKLHYEFRVIYTAHGWVFNEPQARWKRRFYLHAEKWTACFKDQIICIDKHDYRLAIGRLGIPDKKVSIVYHGLSLEKQIFLPRTEARQKLFANIKNAKQLGENDLLVGSIGNLYATKGFRHFVKAMHYLLIDYKLPVTAVIIGEGPERERLEAKIIRFHPMDFDAKNGDVKNKIILAGKIDNASELLKAFDIYICSSVKEGFPYSILEAMAAERPIVTTNVGGIPDMITDEQNGLLVEPEKSRAMAARINWLLTEPGLKEKLAERAKHDVTSRFNYKKMLDQTARIYEL